MQVEPSSGLDAVVGFVLAEEDADRVADVYDDLAVTGIDELGDAFSAVDGDDLDALGDDRRVLFRTDVGFAGDDEQLVLAVPFDVDLQVVVAPFDEDDDAEGDYDVTIDAFELDVEDDAGGEELLETVADDDEVPAGFRDLAEELLGLG